ncbi:MAG TPA: phosphatidate cytidylyltransferase [Bacteroidota bacterium]|nr:phosphatidate cytidylyltransferase [Bacteroidota bacterium]
MAEKFSNLASRVLIAVVGVPAILFVAFQGGVLFFVFVCAVSILGLKEFYDLAAKKGASPQRAVGFVGALFINAAFFHEQIQSFVVSFFFAHGIGITFLSKLQMLLTVLLLLLVLVLIVELFRNEGSLFLNAGYTIFGLLYVGLFLGSLIGLRELFGNEFPYWLVRTHLDSVGGFSDASVHAATYAWGGMTIIAIFASIWLCDTAAYFGGIATGRHKLFVRVSPNKTWEGSVWGFFAAVATMVFAQKFFLPYLEMHQAVVIGAIIGVFGQIGDLVESLFKRDAGVKDSSTLIPGHGGVLDRFDSLIFVSPILYLYIDFIVLS